MIAHEKACKKNPENINACVGCKFLKVSLDCDMIDYFENGEHRQVNGKEYNTFSCLKLNQNMYPAKAKKRIEKYPESFEGKIQMPNTCEHYEVELIEENEF